MKVGNTRYRQRERYAHQLRQLPTGEVKTPPSISRHRERKKWNLRSSCQRLWVLDKYGLPQHEPYIVRWGVWMESRLTNRRLAHAIIEDKSVCTIFLGLDHGFGRLFGHPDDPPVLYETMIFGGDESVDLSQWRYTNREEALKTHTQIVMALRNGDPLP